MSVIDLMDFAAAGDIAHTCPNDPECLVCGANECPHSEPLHWHHDGCPSCEAVDGSAED